MAGLIYSANIGISDSPKAMPFDEDDAKCLLFGDTDAPGWDAAPLPEGVRGSPLFMARQLKVMMPHLMPGFDWYLWLDSTMEVKAPILGMVEMLLASRYDFAAFEHPEWLCSYTEVHACIARGKDTDANMAKAEALLERSKLPKNFGQAATGVLWRRNTEAVKEHALAWWLDMQSTTMRDQATFMLNLWSKKIYLEWIPGLHTKNKWFKYYPRRLK